MVTRDEIARDQSRRERDTINGLCSSTSTASYPLHTHRPTTPLRRLRHFIWGKHSVLQI